jgi:hypothetical protein
MSQPIQNQRNEIQAAEWTEEEATGFVQALATFRDSLPPRQQMVFDGILAAARESAGADDVQGYAVKPLPTIDGLSAASRLIDRGLWPAGLPYGPKPVIGEGTGLRLSGSANFGS